MATRKKTTKKTASKSGWKTCSRGHRYRGAKCEKCWPSGAFRGGGGIKT